MNSRRALAICLPLLALLACADDSSEQAEAIVSTYEPREPIAVDLLLVIDDSPSMRTFASNEDLASNLAAFAQVIDGNEDLGNFRVAITTTSVPGPTCSGALARGGELLMDTCVPTASAAFVGPGELEQDVVDHTDACTDVCSLADLSLRPSPLDDYATDLAIRPWIEANNNSYAGNLPSDVSLEQALVCAGMRGFAGCEYESPLAAASRALEHMRSPGDPAHGFLREGVPLLIVFIGDEDDRSHPDASATIFDPAGDGTFWTSANGPTSGVCHRASTDCAIDNCAIVDRDLTGDVTEQFADAALSSLVRFEAELETLRAERTVVVELVGGVDNVGSLHYWPSDDAARVEEFGWGPGCTAPEGRVAQPPGRLYQLITPQAAYSICDADWSPALAIVFPSIPEQIREWYAPIGTADADPERPGLQPDCELRVRTAIDELWPMPLCLRNDEGGWRIDPETLDYQRPDGADRCWAWRDDPGGLSETPSDDLSAEAVDSGHAASFVVSVRPDSFLPRGSVYESVCTPQ